MKSKKFFATLMAVLFAFVTACKNSNYAVAKANETKTQLVRNIKKAMNDVLDTTEDPEVVFERG